MAQYSIRTTLYEFNEISSISRVLCQLRFYTLPKATISLRLRVTAKLKQPTRECEREGHPSSPIRPYSAQRLLVSPSCYHETRLCSSPTTLYGGSDTICVRNPPQNCFRRAGVTRCAYPMELGLSSVLIFKNTAVAYCLSLY